MDNLSVGILGMGSCLPEKILTNADLEKIVDTTDEWITKRTGILERRVLEKGQPGHELGVEAAKKAIKDAGIAAEDIDLVIVTTETPDYLTPSMACMIQGKIGAKKAAAFDLNAACSGFAYGLTIANQFIKSGTYKYVLLIACESLTKATDWEDRNTCVLFADGAGAAVVGPVEAGTGILGTYIGADGELGHNITLPCCHITDEDLEKREHENKRVIWMDGGEVFKFAVKTLDHAARQVIENANLTLDDIKLIIPHQANIRIIQGAAKRLGVPVEKLFINLNKYGNMSSASIPIALDEAAKSNKIQKGDKVVLVGFGGGLTWGSAVIEWTK